MATMEERNNDQEWTKIINPSESLFRFNFRELWQYRDLIVLFVKRDFVSVYKQTVLGPLWHIIQPLFTTVVFVILGSFAKIPTDDVPRILFYLTGIVLWNYFASCLTKTSGTFIGSAQIFGKVYFPRLTVPISVIVSNLISFFLQFLLIIPFLIYYRSSIHPNLYMLSIPLIIVVIAMMGLGFGLVVSSLTIKYRDLVFLIAFGVQLGMYVTPIIYPLSMVPIKYQLLMSFNPISSIIEMFRYAMLGKGTFTLLSIIYSCAFSIVILVTGILFFNQAERNFVDTV
jgi:lipopolysaccharide transport system permease protein